MADESIRQQILSKWVEVFRATSKLRRVEDTEPYDYDKAPMPTLHIMEGQETVNFGKFHGLALCDLIVVGQLIYKFNSSDPQQSLHRQARAWLAFMQQTVMANLQWGGLAMLTLEGGSEPGKLDSDTLSAGVLTTWWTVRYRRNAFDPYQR